MAEKPDDWLDFRAIKEEADVTGVLQVLGVLDGLVERGAELVGWCPLGTKRHGKRDSFAFNTEKRTFQCFACKAKGSILDFVAHLEGFSLRDAARRVREITEVDSPKRFSETPPDQQERVEPEPAEPPTIETQDTGSLRVTMSFQEAVLKVKAGVVDPNNLQVVDMTTLQELNEVFGISRSA